MKVVFGNFFGSISRCDVIAEGLANFIRNRKMDTPVVISMRGNGAEEGRRILKLVGIEVYDDDQEAARRAVELARGL